MASGKVINSIVLFLVFIAGYLTHGLVSQSVSERELIKSHLLHVRTLHNSLIKELADYSYLKYDWQDLMARQPEFAKGLVEIQRTSSEKSIKELYDKLDAVIQQVSKDAPELIEPIELTLSHAALVIHE